MYTKAKPNGEEAYRIPENYRGNAFHNDTLTPQPPIHIAEETTEDSLEAQETGIPEQAILPAASASVTVSSRGGSGPKHASPLSAFLPPRLCAEKSGILGDIGMEELLIIGILLLLSQSEADNDILLLLVLLLFYK